MSRIFNEENSLDKLLASYKEPVKEPSSVEPVRSEEIIPEAIKSIKKRKKKMFPVFITVFDLEYEIERSIQANMIKSIRRDTDDDMTYVKMNDSEETSYEVRETREEVLALISLAIAKLA